MTYATINLIHESLKKQITEHKSGMQSAQGLFEETARDLGISLDEAAEHPEARGWYELRRMHHCRVSEFEEALEDFLAHDWH